MKKILLVLVMALCFTMICCSASADIEVYRQDLYEEAYNHISTSLVNTDCVLCYADDLYETTTSYCFSVINSTPIAYESYPVTVKYENGKLVYYQAYSKKGYIWSDWNNEWNFEGEWVYQDDQCNYKVEIESIPGDTFNYNIKYKFIDNERSIKSKNFEKIFFTYGGAQGSFDNLIMIYGKPTTLDNGQTVSGVWAYGHELTRVSGGKSVFPANPIPKENVVFKEFAIEGNYASDAQFTYEQLLAEGMNLCTVRSPWYIEGTNCSFEILSLDIDPYWDDALVLTYHLTTDDCDYGYEDAAVPKDACIDFFLGGYDDLPILAGYIKLFPNKVEIELQNGQVSTINKNTLVFDRRR